MLVPIACRFVPYDQWFLTHLDDESKIKHVKLWFLSKCNLVQSPGPRTHRPASPITFASSSRSRSSLDSLDDGYNEDDEYSDQDLLPASSTLVITPYLDPKPGSSSQSVQPGSSPLVDQYTLVSFSTGSMLQDEFPLSWYNLRPYELLEMHPVGTVVPLQRDILAEYIQPYFQAKVRVMRALWNHRSSRFEPPGLDNQGEHPGYKAKDKLAHRLDSFSPKSTALQSEKRRKTKVDWKARWVVVNQGVLSLCKEHVASPPLHQFALSAMRALRGADALERAFSIVAQPRVVCINFRRRPTPVTGVTSPPSSSRSSPISEDFRHNVQEHFLHADFASDSKQTAEQEHSRGRSGGYMYDPYDVCNGEGEWIVLDMLDDHAFSSILRILHRQASHPISSSFVPSPSIVTLSNTSIVSPVATSFSSYDAIPYPEWRINTVENARKAGMGDVGKPMAWVLWADKGLGETLLGNIRHHRQAFSREMQYKVSTFPWETYGSDDESDGDSEMEWEGWIRDLERQSQVKERPDKSSKSAASRLVSNVSSPLPSPPLSEASPTSSPRISSPSLSGSYPNALYPNIGNVIQAQGYHSMEIPQSLERMKNTIVSTVSVGPAPSPRRRSSTLSTEPTRRDRDDGKQDKSSNPVSSPRGSSGMRWSPKTPVRHAHSSSNLRAASYGSDAAESVGHAGPSSGPKRQGTFMRGMSVRAGKIVKGLESAIDFVDEKSV